MSKMADCTEIERKFLIEALPELKGLKSSDVAQGYLTTAKDSVEIRLRKKAKSGNTAFFMTLKSDGALERMEIEVPVSEEQFDSFWPATVGRRVEKTRYVGALSDELKFELDVFHGDLDGLTLVEVEFPSLEAADHFNAPAWFGKDVTADRAYKNKALAVNGKPEMAR
nr:CYTH domain-containing protein [uncultured Cohaesibacter sp.]